MAYLGIFYQEMLSLVLCAAYLSFISCANVNIDIEKWGYDDDYDPWWKKYFTTTEEPDFWWKRFTPDPHNEKDTHIPYNSLSTGYVILLLALVFGVLIFACGLIYCMKYIGQHGNQPAVPSSSGLTIHPPTRNVVPPSENPTTTGFQIPSPVASSAPFFSIFRGPTENSSNINNAIDRPPGYDDVALSDLSAQKTKYPEVNPTVSECPPPKYDENMKY